MILKNLTAAELFFLSPFPSSPQQGEGWQDMTASSQATVQPQIETTLPAAFSIFALNLLSVVQLQFACSNPHIHDLRATLVLQAMLRTFQPERSWIGLGYMFASLLVVQIPHMFTIPGISEIPRLKAEPQITSRTPRFFPSRYLIRRGTYQREMSRPHMDKLRNSFHFTFYCISLVFKNENMPSRSHQLVSSL